MKSGIRMNFLERRAFADRALSRLVRMARDAAPATLSSREQRGVFRLEARLVESSSAPPLAPRWTESPLAARWLAFATFVLTLVHGLWARDRRPR